MNPAFSDLMQKLEAERNDVSYKRPERPEPIVITRNVYPKKAEQEKRDKLMFNAGRYAAGARDSVATKAHQKLEKELSNE